MLALNIYVFLYVFSLSLPLFYHSAFFVGFASLIHLMFLRPIRFFTFDGYIWRFLNVNFLVYMVVFAISLLSGSMDLSFLKTFTNFFLSGLCSAPLAYLILYYKGRDSTRFIAHSFFKVFLIQSLIIIVVLSFPVLKPFVSFFHRNPTLAAELDVFSNGLRTNALSGGLFFGLAISYSICLVISVYHYLVVEKKKPTVRLFTLFIVINVGLVISGRFGLVYIIPMLFFLPAVRASSVSRLLLFGIISITIFVGLMFALYLKHPVFAAMFDDVIYPYVFEMIDSYLAGHGVHSQSTARLTTMYEIDASVYQLIFGEGLYTGSDGLYYKHTDVGFIRHLLFGGVTFVILGFVHLRVLVLPLLRDSKTRYLAYSIFILLFVCSLKGEVFLTMVSVLTPIVLFSYVKYLNVEDVK